MDNNIKDERIQLRISKEQKHKLRVLASIHDMNISSYIIHLIEQDLENNSNLNNLINSFIATTKEDTNKKIILKYTYDSKEWNVKYFNSKNTIDTFLKKNKDIKEYRIIE